MDNELRILPAVRSEIEKLRDADDNALEELNADSVCKRVKWFEENKNSPEISNLKTLPPVEAGYRLLLMRFGITEEEAPIVYKSNSELIFHSMNFCPTLEACKVLNLDTRHICKIINENSTDMLVKQLDPRLKFTRNYDCLRPQANYCEEMISLK